MRDILFRGKRRDNGKWIEGSLVHQTAYYGDPVDRYHILYSGEFDYDYYDAAEVIPETIGQFTGLIDKNGTKIVEGDIVKGQNFLHEDRVIYSVVYDQNGFYYRDEDDEVWHPYIIENVEVIGNIHDNPGYLEDK